MKNQDKPIYPISDLNNHPSLLLGLTKREYFAGLALQATSLEEYANAFGNKWAEYVAKDAILLADEMIKQLEN